MPQPRSSMTIFATAFTSGILLALAAHMLAGHVGIGLVPNWARSTASHDELVRSAQGWWAVAAAGLFGSFVTGLLLREGRGRARRRAALVRLAAFSLFALLTTLPLVVTAAPTTGPAQTLLINMIAFALGLATAFCGGWFSLRDRPTRCRHLV